MSYANGTPNYNLPQTVGSDKRDWSDTNPAFLALDVAVKSASDNATQADGKADNAQTTADSAVASAASAVTTANAANATAQTAAETAQLAQNAATAAQQTATQAASDAQSAQTTANSAQQTASNADTVALRAESNIGTMSNLQTTDKTSLVAAINELVSQIGGGSMPILNYSSPLYTLVNGTSYTASSDCYVVGNLNIKGTAGAPTAALTINSNVVYSISATDQYTSATSVPVFLKVKSGDIILMSNDNGGILKVYAEV